MRPSQVYLASGNAHKAAEFARMLNAANAAGSGADSAAGAGSAPLALEIRSAAELGGMPAVLEDTGTFRGNAQQKVLALRAIAPAGAWVLADDSGLCCDALGGEPGVETAYYAGRDATSAGNRAKLLDVLRDTPDVARGAHFYCLLLLLAPDGAEFAFEGKCFGRILREERGAGGFGYDPLFALGAPDDPARDPRSFAELTDNEKDAVSHRGLAFAAFARWLQM